MDSIQSPHVSVHFDTANIAMFQHAEHWMPILGKRIQNVHLKEFNRRGTDYSLKAFRPLLDGTTNRAAVMDGFEATGYRGYLTFEYSHSYADCPEALIYETAGSLDRIPGLKP